jgi:hypothetical protein
MANPSLSEELPASAFVHRIYARTKPNVLIFGSDALAHSCAKANRFGKTVLVTDSVAAFNEPTEMPENATICRVKAPERERAWRFELADIQRNPDSFRQRLEIPRRFPEIKWDVVVVSDETSPNSFASKLQYLNGAAAVASRETTICISKGNCGPERLYCDAVFKKTTPFAPVGIGRIYEAFRADISARGWKGRICPICETWAPQFRPFGLIPRDNASCPRCGSLERHRLIWLFLSRRAFNQMDRPKTFLHIAPERCLEKPLLRRFGSGYLSADLGGKRAMMRADITRLPFQSQSYDFILCSHVLEHVPDDRKALAEFTRILKPGGMAIIAVPICGAHTFEDKTVKTTWERVVMFGQSDHVRSYGRDIVDRFRDAGLQVTVASSSDLASQEENDRFAVGEPAGELYICAK